MASVALRNKAVGSTIKLKVGGTKRDFIVVHQGKPSSLYDNSCDGTWLLMKDIYETRQWHSSNSNSYKVSTIHSYLNSTFLGLFDANIQAQIKQVKIPYVNGTGNSAVASGANGLSCKIFLLSGYEMGWTTSDNSYFPVDGAKLAYFDAGTGTTANNKRIAYLNGTATVWWLRSPHTSYTTNAWDVYSNGGYGNYYCADTYGVRPALVLPSSLSVSDDGSVTTNTAPSTPGSITIPETINGGATINISWAASTDAENNLEGYVVERSTDGGSAWTQVYQSSGTSTTNSVPYGTESVMYRVKAYDSEGLYSGYRTSAQVTVINNAAPGAPPSITVPEIVMGGARLAITWEAATDQDGNLSGYTLERQVDGGDWEEAYKGADTAYSDNITRGWETVAYRVSAYDSYNAVSEYTTSDTRTVDNNIAPVITCDTASGTDIGKKTAAFSVAYSASDADGDPVTVTEKVDGETVRSFTAEAGQSYTFNVAADIFMKLLNGAHTLTIAASDGRVETVHTITFTKEVTEASITLAEPVEADAKITICVLSVTGSIPQDAEYKVEVTNNAKDDAPNWEDCTGEVKNGANHIFENETAANGFAFNFRVHVKRGASGIGGYINSVQGGFQ